VFIPKCRRKTLYGELRPHLGDVFRKLALQEGKPSRRRPSHAGSRSHDDLDFHQNMRSRKWSDLFKGKSAIHLARVYGEKKRNL